MLMLAVYAAAFDVFPSLSPLLPLHFLRCFIFQMIFIDAAAIRHAAMPLFDADAADAR